MKFSLPFADKLPKIPNRAMPAIGAPVMVLATLAMVVLPIPAFLLDMFFTFNIALSMVVLLVSVYTRRPLDFAAFPTVLLIATLLRLALNVASTRVVLLHGHEGGDAAGNVILKNKTPINPIELLYFILILSLLIVLTALILQLVC